MQTITLVRVISLTDAHARRQAMAQRLADTGLKWAFFDAHRRPMEPLSYCERDAWIAKGRPLVPQELGCYSSHYFLWKSFLEGPATQLFVLEDDAFADWRYITEEVLPFDFGSLGIDLLRLYGGYPARCRLRCNLGDRKVFRLLGHVEGTLAYILSRRGAERLLLHCRKIKLPIDDEVDRSWIHGVHSFAVFPYPVMELTVPTQIPDRNIPRSRRPHKLAHFCFRIYDKSTNWLMV